MSNLLSMGVKVALALASNYSSGGLDRDGNEISPVEVRTKKGWENESAKVPIILIFILMLDKDSLREF